MTLALRRRENTPRSRRVVWGPLSELEELQDRTVQLLENVWPGGGLAGALADPRSGRRWSTSRRPTMRGSSKPKCPGVRRKDVNVEVRDSEVVISGEIKERERKGHHPAAHAAHRRVRVSRHPARRHGRRQGRGQRPRRRADGAHPEVRAGAAAAGRGDVGIIRVGLGGVTPSSSARSADESRSRSTPSTTRCRASSRRRGGRIASLADLHR